MYTFSKHSSESKLYQCSVNVVFGPIHMYPDTFENASFLSVLSLHLQVDSVLSHRKRSFSKMLSRLDLVENAVFILARGRVKAELFENADVSASAVFATYQTMSSGLWGSREEICLSVFFDGIRIFSVQCSGIFVWMQILFYSDKKRCVVKHIRIRVDVTLVYHLRENLVQPTQR